MNTANTLKKMPPWSADSKKSSSQPPSVEESIAILDGLKTKYEEHHKCIYTDAAIKAAVYLSDRYISGRFLPDKAIDLIDEAGAKARIAMMHQPQDITKFEARNRRGAPRQRRGDRPTGI